MHTVETGKFIFTNQIEDLYPLTLQMLSFIKSEATVDEPTEQKVRIVLIELLTNAIKHAGVTESTIEIMANDDEIIIQKSDIGSALALNCNGLLYNWPLPGMHQGGRNLSVYGDDAFTLKAALVNGSRVKFFTEENPNTKTAADALYHLPEHFGLMIITRVCRVFEYEFDIETCSNNFTATFAIGHYI